MAVVFTAAGFYEYLVDLRRSKGLWVEYLFDVYAAYVTTTNHNESFNRWLKAHMRKWGIAGRFDLLLALLLGIDENGNEVYDGGFLNARLRQHRDFQTQQLRANADFVASAELPFPFLRVIVSRFQLTRETINMLIKYSINGARESQRTVAPKLGEDATTSWFTIDGDVYTVCVTGHPGVVNNFGIVQLCTCPFAVRRCGLCKHVVMVLLWIEEHRGADALGAVLRSGLPDRTFALVQRVDPVSVNETREQRSDRLRAALELGPASRRSGGPASASRQQAFVPVSELEGPRTVTGDGGSDAEEEYDVQPDNDDVDQAQELRLRGPPQADKVAAEKALAGVTSMMQSMLMPFSPFWKGHAAHDELRRGAFKQMTQILVTTHAKMAGVLLTAQETIYGPQPVVQAPAGDLGTLRQANARGLKALFGRQRARRVRQAANKKDRGAVSLGARQKALRSQNPKSTIAGLVDTLPAGDRLVALGARRSASVIDAALHEDLARAAHAGGKRPAPIGDEADEGIGAPREKRQKGLDGLDSSDHE